jgi:hypothetical protein
MTSVTLRLRSRGGRHALVAVADQVIKVFPLRQSREVAEALVADRRTAHILEPWARAPADVVQLTIAQTALQVLAEDLACRHYGVEAEYLEVRFDGS